MVWNLSFLLIFGGEQREVHNSDNACIQKSALSFVCVLIIYSDDFLRFFLSFSSFIIILSIFGDKNLSSKINSTYPMFLITRNMRLFIRKERKGRTTVNRERIQGKFYVLNKKQKRAWLTCEESKKILKRW